MPQEYPAQRRPPVRRDGPSAQAVERIAWRLVVTTIVVLWMAACVTIPRNPRIPLYPQVPIVDERPPVCGPRLALGQREAAGKESYYLTVDVLTVRPETLQGEIDPRNYFVVVRRRDAAIEAGILDARRDQRRLRDELRELRRRRATLRAQAAGDSDVGAVEEEADAEAAEERQAAGRLLVALEETRRNTDLEYRTARTRERQLHRRMSGKTPIRSSQRTVISFDDLPMPFKIYNGDRIEIAVVDEDVPGEDDLIGRTLFVVDTEILETGHLEVTAGHVQSLSLGFRPCNMQRPTKS